LLGRNQDNIFNFTKQHKFNLQNIICFPELCNINHKKSWVFMADKGLYDAGMFDEFFFDYIGIRRVIADNVLEMKKTIRINPGKFDGNSP